MSSTPSKRKGTAGETEFLRRLANLGIYTRRTPASSKYDLERDAGATGDILNILATRPDRCPWLVTMTVEDFAHMLTLQDRYCLERGLGLQTIHIEVKRRKAQPWHHRIFKEKFG